MSPNSYSRGWRGWAKHRFGSALYSNRAGFQDAAVDVTLARHPDAGRHLLQFRPEHELCLFFPSAIDQTTQLPGALALGGSARHELRTRDADAKRIAAGLDKHLGGAKLELLKDIVQRQPNADPAARMRAYRKRAERAALRDGLLSCGDIEIAVRMTERFPSGAELPSSERRTELLSFSVGASDAHLRRRLGVAISG